MHCRGGVALKTRLGMRNLKRIEPVSKPICSQQQERKALARSLFSRLSFLLLASLTRKIGVLKPVLVCWFVLTGLPITTPVLAVPVEVAAPREGLKASFEVQDGKLFYSLSDCGRAIVERSRLGVFDGAKMAFVNASIREHDKVWSPTYGQFNTVRDHYRELNLSLTADGKRMTLLCRMFDTGFGLRFVATEDSAGQMMTFASEYKLADSIAHYAGERGHRCAMPGDAPTKPSQLKELDRPTVPLVSLREDGRHVAFLEADLYSADGFELMQLQPTTGGESLMATSTSQSLGEGHVTPWRVILIGDSAGDLVVNNVPLNLAAPCKLENTGWIMPGKSLWDWRIHGYDNGSFVYGIDTRSYLRLIDFCAEQGIEYLTVDDHWFLAADDGEMVVSPRVDVAEVMDYAKQKGVLIMLYYDRKKGNFGDETLFSHYAKLGATAIKYGFMGNKADFTRRSIDAAAEHKLLINFHDGPVPMTGVERTMPNLITREFCHAQQDSRSVFTPETFLRMAMVSTLSGPLDMSNGNFGITSINSGERIRGPREKNSYITTVISEIARNVVIFSGIVTLPDAPEEYLKKGDLFEFLRLMPSTWDDTQIPNSKIGQYITVARRSGDMWFVGSVNNQTVRTLSIPLNFLIPGTQYEATLYEDAEGTHGVANPEAYAVSTSTVIRGDVISAKMAFGGGHAMILRPLKQQQSE